MSKTPGLPAQVKVIDQRLTELRAFTERELAEHDIEIDQLRDSVAKRFEAVGRKLGKIGQGLRNLRKVVSLVRRTLSDLAGRPPA